MLRIDSIDCLPITDSTDENLIEFIEMGIERYRKGELSSDIFKKGISRLNNKFGKTRIDSLLLKIIFNETSYTQQKKKSTSYRGYEYEFIITDEMKENSYKQLDNIFLEGSIKNIASFPQIEYKKDKDSTLDDVSKGEQTMRGYDYVSQRYLGRKHYTHMRAMLQQIWDIQHKHPAERFDIDGQYQYDPNRLSSWIINNASTSEIDMAHRAVVENYKSRGRPKGARNKNKVVGKDMSALENMLEDVIIDANTQEDVKQEDKSDETIEATLLDSSKFVTHPQLDKKAAELRMDMHTIATNISDALVDSYNKLEDKVNNIQLHQPTLIEIKRVDLPNLDLGVQHRTFETLLRICSSQLRNGNRIIPWVYGPAGTGKSTAAENVAKALGLDCYVLGKTLVKFEVVGFINTSGYQTTEFRKAYEFGGVFCADEMDAWSVEASVALNGALANGHHAFPDKTITRHKDFVMIACANTVGAGATLDYAGRNKQDGATLDRFVSLYWPLDEALEDSICANKEWISYVRHVRGRANASGINPKPMITPRASIHGEALLAAGLDMQIVIDVCLRKGLSDPQWALIK